MQGRGTTHRKATSSSRSVKMEKDVAALNFVRQTDTLAMQQPLQDSTNTHMKTPTPGRLTLLTLIVGFALVAALNSKAEESSKLLPAVMTGLAKIDIATKETKVELSKAADNISTAWTSFRVVLDARTAEAFKAAEPSTVKIIDAAVDRTVAEQKIITNVAQAAATVITTTLAPPK